MKVPGSHIEALCSAFKDELEKISFKMKQTLPNVGTAPSLTVGPALGSDATPKLKMPGAMKISKPTGGLKMPKGTSISTPRAAPGKI